MVDFTPNPSPSRANYGFALYLASYSAFGLYIIWLLLPDFLLELIGLTFLPQKYWAVAIPVHACVTIALIGFVFYPALNMVLVPRNGSVNIITDQYAKTATEYNPNGVPPVSDIPITKVSEDLFLYEKN